MARPARKPGRRPSVTPPRPWRRRSRRFRSRIPRAYARNPGRSSIDVRHPTITGRSGGFGFGHRRHKPPPRGVVASRPCFGNPGGGLVQGSRSHAQPVMGRPASGSRNPTPEPQPDDRESNRLSASAKKSSPLLLGWESRPRTARRGPTEQSASSIGASPSVSLIAARIDLRLLPWPVFRSRSSSNKHCKWPMLQPEQSHDRLEPGGPVEQSATGRCPDPGRSSAGAGGRPASSDRSPGCSRSDLVSIALPRRRGRGPCRVPGSGPLLFRRSGLRSDEPLLERPSPAAPLPSDLAAFPWWPRPWNRRHQIVIPGNPNPARVAVSGPRLRPGRASRAMDDSSRLPKIRSDRPSALRVFPARLESWTVGTVPRSCGRLPFLFILLGAELFTNGNREWFGRKLEPAEGRSCPVLAAVGTALSLTMNRPIIRESLGSGGRVGRRPATGRAIWRSFVAPFMLAPSRDVREPAGVRRLYVRSEAADAATDMIVNKNNS